MHWSDSLRTRSVFRAKGEGPSQPLAAETHEEWIEGTRYLNMELLHQHKKQQLKAA